MNFLRELKFAGRSLRRNPGLTVTVMVTLALGIGANAAIFSLVRGVLLRPLANSDESRLLYIRQSAPGIGMENTTFSMPEIADLRSGVTTISALGDFSTIGFTLVGLGEPREVRAGVVGGSYFEVMGLRPVLGRLLGHADDGPDAAPAAVLTYRFWTSALHADATVVGKTVRLGARPATIVGVLEPSVPYPADTELLANVVSSPHHLSATMVQGRAHRMTELFGRLAPGVSLETAFADLHAVHGAMMRQHPEIYSAKADTRIQAVPLRDQLTSRARTVLLVLLAAAGLVFLVACSNVANLILARSLRREGELATRQALGATAGALRRTLLAESLLLCGAGAALGVILAGPTFDLLARYCARFSVRAVDLSADATIPCVGALLAVIAGVLLAFVPKLPSGQRAGGRVTSGNTRRLQGFAVTQIAASFILLVGAATLGKTLAALQSVETGIQTRQVLALNVPVMAYGRTPGQIVSFYREALSRLAQLPGVERVSLGTQVPWRDAGSFGPGFEVAADGRVPAQGEESPRARFRTVSPGFFATLGLPLLAGRDFNQLDRAGSEPVAIVSQSLAKRLFPGEDAVNHHLAWTDPIARFVGIGAQSRRIVGVVADMDDEHVIPGPSLAVYHSFEQERIVAGRLFLQAKGDPHALATPVRRAIREISPDQPVERAATLDDIRAEILTPDRLNTVVFGAFAAVALAIAVVGVAGVLAFSVSSRKREFGIRLALGSDPRQLVNRVLAQGAAMAGVGVAAGALGGLALARVAGSYLQLATLPGAAVVAGSAAMLLAAAVGASLIPALPAARVDVLEALRSE